MKTVILKKCQGNSEEIPVSFLMNKYLPHGIHSHRARYFSEETGREKKKKKVSNPQTNSQIIGYSVCHTTPNIFLDCTGNSQEVVLVKHCSELFYSLLYYSLSE